ncbi:hypothetical protein [Paenibacillus apis]|uniref:Uncharacterized protein n=1 Tax=Paenibacillus apis TaxID=1792174 RepID=A0A920CPT0_9BACL|nr:hypothetical protein [Paenibacillus apis]GIO44562.1 hypothetical protein J41TS4_43200 [Paenibacillus apis]
MIGILIIFLITIGINWRLQNKDDGGNKDRVIVMIVSVGLFLLAELFFFYQDQWTIPMLLRKASSML